MLTVRLRNPPGANGNDWPLDDKDEAVARRALGRLGAFTDEDADSMDFRLGVRQLRASRRPFQAVSGGLERKTRV